MELFPTATEVIDPKLITVPLRDFALPVPRTGSIEPHSGYGRAALEGQEIHLRVQKRRGKLDPRYQSEVPISATFDRNGYRFRIEGRMDGIFRHDIPKIEEIKSTFNLRELARRLAHHPMRHPYCLQLQSYGFFYWLEHGVVPELTFHLVCSRSGDSEEMALPLDLTQYEQWLELRLDELAREAAKAEQRGARRRRIASAFPFPFPNPRPGQTELMAEIEAGMAQRRPLLIQAPTGLGKTVGVLYPVLKEALGRGQRVVYVTPKNSQHAVAEDAVQRFREQGAPLVSLSITAKGKICFKNEPVCTPEYCEYSRDYYDKLYRDGVLDALGRKRKLTARTFRELGEKHQLCPFELQLDCVPQADVVICDYNYVFAPRSALNRPAGVVVDQSGKPNLVIDEAHNLPGRALEYYSPALSSLRLVAMREEVGSVPAPLRHEARELLERSLEVIAGCRAGGGALPSRFDAAVEPFLEQDGRLRSLLSRYLETNPPLQRQDLILRLVFYWSAFTEALEYAADPAREEFFTTYHPHATGGTVKITCCDASELIKGAYAAYQQVVGFSATLKPFDYYAKLSGMDPARVRTAEFRSPFPEEQRKLLIIPQISTRYAQRNRNYVKVADAVRRIVALRKGNYFAFFPSFDFLERVADLFHPPEGFVLLRQERNMKGARVEEILEHLKAGETPTVVFGVQGGSFSEGVDYAGDMVVGAFVVGPPLPNFDLERELMREYYQRRHGAGFEYAYTIPAMAKAVQAAGRVIRSETDRGVIVLMDDRFLQPGYRDAMPADWYRSDARELVSGSILRDLSLFWEEE